MDELPACAKAFENLFPVKYHIIIGRKGKSVNLTVSFDAVEFHRLVGLHKLHDLRLSRANREKVFLQILSGQIALNDVKKNRYFCNIQKGARYLFPCSRAADAPLQRHISSASACA